MLNRTGYIYTLVDPRTDEVRYVGRTVEPHQRLRQHLKDSHSSDIREWVNELQNEDLEPEMYLINVDDEEYLDSLERRAIVRLNREWDLLNQQEPWAFMRPQRGEA
jgi:hypothetical protein